MTQQTTDNHLISLLWPAHIKEARQFTLPDQTIQDLQIEETINFFDTDRQLRNDVRAVLINPTVDPQIIRYRQEILQDLLKFPQIQKMLEEIWPKITSMTVYQHAVDRKRSSLQQLAWRASELENLVETVNALTQSLDPQSVALRSAGLQALYQKAQSVASDPSFQKLEKELPEILPQLRANVSVTIGVNLDRQLRPVEAVLLDIREEKFEEAPFLDRLLGRNRSTSSRKSGLAPIHRAPQDLFQVPKNSEIGRKRADPLMAPLFRDLAEVLDKIVKPLDRVLKEYVSLNGGFLSRLRHEIGFYTAACRLYHKLQEQGLAVSFPKIAPLEDRVCEIKGAYNLNLVRHLTVTHPGLQIGDQIVQNDCLMGEQWGRIFILTGPNQGGKTTYTQMVGLIQILAQAGLFVPGSSATISPADGIYTHYPIEEKLEKATGRFGDEAQRLSGIFQQAGQNSLILLNESLASTNPGESIYLAQEIVKIFRQMGVRVIFNTHLHELAENLEALNQAVAGESKIVSVVASKMDGDSHPGHRSFHLQPGPPMGRSYALEIAAKYGIRFDQLQMMLQERGLIHDARREDQST